MMAPATAAVSQAPPELCYFFSFFVIYSALCTMTTSSHQVDGGKHFFTATSKPAKGNTHGDVCMVNNLWCSDVEIISSGCSPGLELLMIRCRPHYIPREFISVVLTAV